jgi:phosphohistidine phosphatase SixA
MTRKDYQLIAGTISKLMQGLNGEECFKGHIPVVRELVNSLSDKLEEDNPRFNRATFWRACALD